MCRGGGTDQLILEVYGITDAGRHSIRVGGWPVKALTSTGDVAASNIRGNINLKGGQGSVHLSNIMRHAKVRTTLGSITGSRVAGDFDAIATGGAIRVTD